MIGIRSDILFPAYQVREVADVLQRVGRDGRYVELDSPNGHDAFLNDVEVMARHVEASCLNKSSSGRPDEGLDRSIARYLGSCPVETLT